ncbi:MAG: hypothetical protein WKF96_00190 [Solirubrobacteraceae bacterium]
MDTATPTGLALAEINGLTNDEQITLAAWQSTVSGDDDGRPWLPGAIRQLPARARLDLATDPELDLLWQERERRRCIDSVSYFAQGYGHVRDEDAGGPPIPFHFWPTQPTAAARAVGAHNQAELLALMEAEALLIVLKARQLGVTWLALHYGFHLLALEPSTPGAVVLALSQDGNYAKRLLERVRKINQLLPPFLRCLEERDTRESKSEMKLQGRGRIVSLPGTKEAPRSWQCDLAICDEWAFVRNTQAGPTMRALLPMASQIISVSSGNGPPEEEGWGQHFAQTYTRAAAGENQWTAAFLPTSTHPARDAAFRARTIRDYDTEEEFLAEHPESDDDALIGAGRDRYFKLAEINAAVALGRALDALLDTDAMPPPAGEAIHGGLDWGEHSTGVPVWPLEGGGVYVPPGETGTEKAEPETHCVAFHAALAALQTLDRATGRLTPPIGEQRYDAAGIQSNRAFMAVTRARYAHQYLDGAPRSRKVPFGSYKRETAGYLRRLFKRTHEGRTAGVIAISPTNVELIRQLRGLESDGNGLWKKQDDHFPDGLVAGVQRIARTHRELQGK